MGERLRRVMALLRDPRTPRLPRAAVVLSVLYLIWPVDLIPDFVIPLVGFVDDAALVWMALRWLVKAGPPAEGQPAAAGSQSRPGPLSR